jgi:hypothetical protein
VKNYTFKGFVLIIITAFILGVTSCGNGKSFTGVTQIVGKWARHSPGIPGSSPGVEHIEFFAPNSEGEGEVLRTTSGIATTWRGTYKDLKDGRILLDIEETGLFQGSSINGAFYYVSLGDALRLINEQGESMGYFREDLFPQLIVIAEEKQLQAKLAGRWHPTKIGDSTIDPQKPEHQTYLYDMEFTQDGHLILYRFENPNEVYRDEFYNVGPNLLRIYNPGSSDVFPDYLYELRDNELTVRYFVTQYQGDSNSVVPTFLDIHFQRMEN